MMALPDEFLVSVGLLCVIDQQSQSDCWERIQERLFSLVYTAKSIL